MTKIKVQDEKNLFRDSKTNAIVNTDKQSYLNYINTKRIKESESKRIQNLEDELFDIKSDLKEIKNLLRAFANESK
jgi:hypothetical protein